MFEFSWRTENSWANKLLSHSWGRIDKDVLRMNFSGKSFVSTLTNSTQSDNSMQMCWHSFLSNSAWLIIRLCLSLSAFSGFAKIRRVIFCFLSILQGFLLIKTYRPSPQAATPNMARYIIIIGRAQSSVEKFSKKCWYLDVVKTVSYLLVLRGPISKFTCLLQVRSFLR